LTNQAIFAIMLLLNKKIKNMKTIQASEAEILKKVNLQYEDVEPQKILVNVYDQSRI
jgi:hypothetical protein